MITGSIPSLPMWVDVWAPRCEPDVQPVAVRRINSSCPALQVTLPKGTKALGLKGGGPRTVVGLDVGVIVGKVVGDGVGA